MMTSPEPVSQMEVYVTAQKLRELMTCHDKATRQMILLDSRIRETTRRHRRVVHSPLYREQCRHLEERIGIYEWMRDAYDEYRCVKWFSIQQIIFTMFNGMYVPHTINSIISMATHHLYSGTADESMDIDSIDDEDMDDTSVLYSDSSFVSFHGDRVM